MHNKSPLQSGYMGSFENLPETYYSPASIVIFDLREKDNLSIVDEMASPQCVLYFKVPLYSSPPSIIEGLL